MILNSIIGQHRQGYNSEFFYYVKEIKSYVFISLSCLTIYKVKSLILRDSFKMLVYGGK